MSVLNYRFNQVGKNVDKVDGYSLACGRALFVDDWHTHGLLCAAVLRSPHAHAEISGIDAAAARELPGVKAAITYMDLPRNFHTTAGQGFPEPSPYDSVVLDKKVRFVGDAVAAVAAETREIAEMALGLVRVEYRVLEPVFDPEKAMETGSPVIHDEEEARMIIPVEYDPKRNMAARVTIEAGDTERGFGDSDLVIMERKYHVHYAQHTPIEPHIVITYLDEMNRLVIRTSTQVPFHVRRIVGQALNIPVKKIRVIKPRIGGGFGAKQEVMIEQLCAALTMKTGMPVKLEFTREEEFVSSRTRHPQIITLKTGVQKDGTVSTIDMRVLSNTGAYGSHALTVVSNCGSKTLPLYRWRNIRFQGTTVYTNLPVAGAYRGYGATQAFFALEVQMDEIAEALGIDPVEFRQKNHIRVGETSPVFKALGEGKEGVEQKIGSCGLEQCISLGAEAIGWREKRRRKADSSSRLKRGMGMACLMQGSSIPEIDMGAASIKMNDDGSFNLLVGATDLGTGSDTVLAQIAAETLGVRTDEIIVYSSDTDMTPFDVGAYASSTTYLSGNAVRKAASQIRAMILNVAAEITGEPADSLMIENGTVNSPASRKITFSEIAMHSLYVNNQFQIAATASHVTHLSPPPFSAHFAEVEVDTETGLVKVLKYVAAIDCGTAINPPLVKGQTEGAVLNGISYALTEEFFFSEKGRVLNPDFNNYKIFTTQDLPEIVTIIVPTYEESGPYGAKSVSEISINGPLPAISNAIYHAAGIRLRHSPFTPEKVLAELKKKDNVIT